MARTLLDLAKSLEARAISLPKENSEAAKRKALAVVRYLTGATPVDTSKALSNWRVSLNSPVNGSIGPYYPGTAGSTAEASENTANLSAEAVLQNKKPGDVIYVSNTLPYIRSLDEGSSSQHPGGFVATAQLIARKTK